MQSDIKCPQVIINPRSSCRKYVYHCCGQLIKSIQLMVRTLKPLRTLNHWGHFDKLKVFSSEGLLINP